MRVETCPKLVIRSVLALLLLAVVLPLYLTFRSCSMDDFDSYNFALALREFNLELQQPQPPGFPVYVALGRLLLAVCPDPLSALTLLSALAGAGLMLVLYGLGEHRPLTGVGAALLIGLSPMGWLTAEKALSDVPGLALTLLAIWALWRGREKLSAFAMGCFFAGLGLGLRPQNGLPVLLLLTGLVVRHLWLRRPVRAIGLGGLTFAGGIVVWMLPTLHAVGGFSAYMTYLRNHSAHVWYSDSLCSTPLTAASLHGRVVEFADAFLQYTVGLTLYAPWDQPQITRALIAIGVVLPGLVNADWRRPRAWLLMGWAALIAAQIFLFEATGRPRLLLPLLPPLALLVSEGWARVHRPRWLAPAVLCFTALGLLRLTLPRAVQLSTVPAPPVQAATYVAAHYPPQETVLAAAGSFRAVQWELPEYRLLYLYQFDPIKARSIVQGPVRYLVIFDYEQFSEEVLHILTNAGQMIPLEERVFRRDPRVHIQHWQVKVKVFVSAALMAEALPLPSSGCLDIGSTEDERYLDRGWYYAENIGGVSGRWAGEVPTTTVRLSLPPGHDYRLTLRALAYPDGQEVTLRVNGKPVAHFGITGSWETYTVTVPAEVVSAGVNYFELIHTWLVAPFDRTNGESSDQRPLAVAYDWLCLSPLDK